MRGAILNEPQLVAAVGLDMSRYVQICPDSAEYPRSAAKFRVCWGDTHDKSLIYRYYSIRPELLNFRLSCQAGARRPDQLQDAQFPVPTSCGSRTTKRELERVAALRSPPPGFWEAWGNKDGEGSGGPGIVCRPPAKGPSKGRPPLNLSGVHVWEESAPAGAEPLEWFLLTSLKVPAERAADRMLNRWRGLADETRQCGSGRVRRASKHRSALGDASCLYRSGLLTSKTKTEIRDLSESGTCSVSIDSNSLASDGARPSSAVGLRRLSGPNHKTR